VDADGPYLSVVVPCFNEEQVLPVLVERVTAVCRKLSRSYELVLVNDGSWDRTWERMTELAASAPGLVCVNLSRNYGHQLALTAGLQTCRGERVLLIDADLQDPPEILPDMLAALDRERADVVYGRRTRRAGETWAKKATAHLYYRLLGRLSDCPIPADTGDFRLMTRRAVDALLAMPDRVRYIRGMVSWIGFRQVPFDYARHPRAAGETHYTVRKMLRYAWDGITGFSTAPLTAPLHAGAACLGLAGLTAAAAIWWGIAAGAVPSLGLLAALVLMLAGGQFLALGVLGEYVGRTLAEARGRPLFVIDEVLRGDAANAATRRAA
jgi:polyisoprenyl-phosphate glycosyltransferase